MIFFVANSEKCCKYTFLGGPPRLLRYYIGGLSKFITILHGGGVFPIYYNITSGRGGSLGTPNLYYVIYGWPLTWVSLCTSCFDTFQNDVSALKFWMSCLPSTVEADRILCPRKLTSNSFRGKSASCVPNTFPRNCHNRIRPSQRFPEVPWADSLKTGKVKYTKPRSGNYSALPYPINMQFSAPFTIYQYHWTLNILFSTCSIHGWTAG